MLDPSMVRQPFNRYIGITFLDMARLRRAGHGINWLAAGDTVIDGQLEGGYDSSNGFRNAVAWLAGGCPAALKGRALLKAGWIGIPIGAMLAVADTSYLHLLEFFDRKALPAELTHLRKATRSQSSLADSHRSRGSRPGCVAISKVF
jgi:AraC family transcriptional regulator of adaptative response/methylated-DNA-[protein]-cysteine methyltransferase